MFDVKLEDGSHVGKVKRGNLEIDRKRSITKPRLKACFKEKESKRNHVSQKEFRKCLRHNLDIQVSAQDVNEMAEAYAGGTDLINYARFVSDLPEHSSEGIEPKHGDVLITAETRAILAEAYESKRIQKKLAKRMPFTIENFALFANSAMKLEEDNAKLIAKLFDSEGRGIVNLDLLGYYSTCWRMGHFSSEVLETLDRCRKAVYGTAFPRVPRHIDEIMKKCQELDQTKQGVVDGKIIGSLLYSKLKIAKKDIDVLVTWLAKNSSEEYEESEESEESEDENHEDKKTVARNSSNRLRLGFKLGSLSKIKGVATNYKVLLRLIAAPIVNNDDTKQILLTNIICAKQNGLDFLSRLSVSKSFTLAEFSELLLEKIGLSVTSEIILRIALLSDVKIDRESLFQSGSETKIPQDKVFRWLLKISDLATTDSGKFINKAVQHFQFQMKSTIKRKKRFMAFFHGNDENEALTGPEAISRDMFITKCTAANVENPLHIRIIAEWLDPKHEDQIDLSALWDLLHEESTQSLASDESELEATSDASTSEIERETMGAGEKIIDCHTRKTLRQFGRTMQSGNGVRYNILRKLMKTKKDFLSDGEEQGSNSDEGISDEGTVIIGPRYFSKFLEQAVKLRNSEVEMVTKAFSKDEQVDSDSFTRYVSSLLVPLPKQNDPVYAPLLKLRLAANQLQKRALAQNHYGLLDRKKSLDQRVRSLLKSKAPKLATRENVQNLINRYQDEGKLIRQLGKKYKILVPPSLYQACKVVANSDLSTYADAKTTWGMIQKQLGVKLEQPEIKSLCDYYDQSKDGTIDFVQITDTLSPNVSTQRVCRTMKRYLALSRGVKTSFHENFFKLLKKKSVPEHMVWSIMRAYGLPLGNMELCRFTGAAGLRASGSCDSAVLRGWLEKAPSSKGETSSDSMSTSSEQNEDGIANGGDGLVQPNKWFRKMRGKKLVKIPLSDEESETGSEDEDKSLKSTKGFLFSNDLRRRICSLFQSQISASQPRRIEKALKNADRKGNGTINVKAFKKLAASACGLGKLSKSEMQQVTKCLDVMQQGDILIIDILRLLRTVSSEEERAVIRTVKFQFEKNNNHRKSIHSALEKYASEEDNLVIYEKDFVRVLKQNGVNLKKKDFHILLHRFDRSDHGYILVDEFVDTITPEVDMSHLSRKLRHFFQLLKPKSQVSKIFCQFRSEGNTVFLPEFYNLLTALGFPLADSELLVLSRCLGYDAKSGEGELDLQILEEFAKGRGRLSMLDDDLSQPEDSASITSNGADSETESYVSPGRQRGKKILGSRNKQATESEPESEESESDFDTKLSSQELSLSENCFSRTSEESDSDDTGTESQTTSPSDANSSGKIAKSNARHRSRSNLRKKAFKLEDDYEYQSGIKKAIRRSFDIIDVDRNGYIDKRELSRVLLAMGREVSEGAVDEVMARGDKNKDGKLSRKEFIKITMKLMDEQGGRLFPQRECDIRDLFQQIDMNNDGTVTPEEFQKAVRTMCSERIERSTVNELMKLADTDEDGTISYDEFIELIKGVAAGRTMKSSRGVKTLLKRIIRGPVPDPTNYLRTFAMMPNHFRPGVMQELDTSHDHSMEAAFNDESGL